MSVLSQTAVEQGGDTLAVEMLANNYEFYHPVTVFRIPVAHHVGIVALEHLEVFLGSGGKPEAGLGETFLHPRLLEEIRHVGIIAEIHHTLGAYDIAGPLASGHVVKHVEVKRLAAEIDKRAYAVFLRLALSVVVMVVMMVALLIAFVIVIMVVLVLVVMVMVMVMVVLVVMVVVIMVAFYLLDPTGGCGYSVEVEETCIENLGEVDVGKIGLYYLCLWLDGADYGAETSGLFRSHLRDLIEHHDVAEFNLLNNEVLDIFFVYVAALQLFAAVKFRLHAQGVDHSDYAVEPGGVVVVAPGSHTLHGAECLGNGLWLTDTGGFDYDIVKFPRGHKLAHLEHEVALESAADASVLERHEVVGIFGCTDYTTFLNEGGIDIYFTDVIDYHSKAYAAAVGENTVEKGGLSTSEISGEKHHRCWFMSHILV